VFIGFSLLAGALAAEPPDKARWGLPELMARLAAIPSATARFREEKHLSMLNEPLIVEGALAYARPDFLQKRALAPREENYEIRGDQLTIDIAGEKRRQLSLAEQPVLLAFAESLRAVLTGDLPRLERYYRVQFIGSEKRWALLLKPLDAAIAKYVVAITVQGQDNRVTRIKTEETDGDYTLMLISSEPSR
jgi:hypothetical protein